MDQDVPEHGTPDPLQLQLYHLMLLASHDQSRLINGVEVEQM